MRYLRGGTTGKKERQEAIVGSIVKRFVESIGRKPLAVDVGGRYGLHAPFVPLLGHANIVAYDADSDAEGLDAEGVRVIRKALSGDGQRRTLFVTRKGGCSSFFRPRPEIYAAYDGGPTCPDMAASRTEVVKEIELETVTLDQSSKEIGLGEPDFIKLDVEGMELEILGGLPSLARASVVEVEAEWVQLYQGQPLAPDVLAFMYGQGFSLWDMQTTFWAMPVGGVPGEVQYHNKGRAIFSNLLFVNTGDGVDRNVPALGLFLYGFVAEAANRVGDEPLRSSILAVEECVRPRTWRRGIRQALHRGRKGPRPAYSQTPPLVESQRGREA